MAQRMIQELLARIADPDREPAHAILDTQLVLRDST
jgi:DNA-binding LacI/PurR family transcriptional regulator